jgi:F-type H+-transporting ATPase subunit gamma
MANQRDIKRRIVSVANTQKITKAMKLVSAAKFARASHAVNAARPYSTAFDLMVKRLVANSPEPISSELVKTREEKKVLVIIIGTDRGLCGGLNANLFKGVRHWVKQKRSAGIQVDVAPLGRKAISWGKKQNLGITFSREKVIDKPSFFRAKELAREFVGMFNAGTYDSIYLAYNIFQNALTQTPKVSQYLPVNMDDSAENEAARDYIVEPSIGELIDSLLERKLATMLFQALLDSAASEHGSRMTAMDNATSNAGEVRKKLTLKYNRARQASITKELIEIVSGAEAL